MINLSYLLIGCQHSNGNMKDSCFFFIWRSRIGFYITVLKQKYIQEEISRLQYISGCNFIKISHLRSLWDHVLTKTIKVATNDRAHIKSLGKKKI